jgi:hypothetical protein
MSNSRTTGLRANFSEFIGWKCVIEDSPIFYLKVHHAHCLDFKILTLNEKEPSAINISNLSPRNAYFQSQESDISENIFLASSLKCVTNEVTFRKIKDSDSNILDRYVQCLELEF